MQRKQLVFQEASDDLKEKIRRHVIAPGAMLPSESELCRHYSISRVSIRKALELLDREGLIFRQAGVGTFAREQKIKQVEPRTLNIGISNTKPNLYTEGILTGAQKACAESNSQLILINPIDFINGKWKDLDAFIMIPTENTTQQLDISELDRISAENVPVAVINRFCDSPNISYFSVDYTLEAERAVKFLYRLGAKSVGMIDAPSVSTYASTTRTKGYRSAIKQAGHQKLELSIAENISAVGSIKQFIEQNQPDSLFVTMGTTLDYVLMACNLCEKKPGRDISIFCFDRIDKKLDETAAEVIYLDMPLETIGRDTVNHLIARKNNPYGEKIAKKLFGVRFMINSSTV